MADEQEPHAPSRFRLPRLFGQAAETAHVEPDHAELPSTREEPSPATATATAGSGSGAGSMVVGPFVAGSVVAALAGGKNRGAAKDAARDAAPAPSETQNELAALRQAVEDLSEQISQVNHRETSLERVFDALHAELADYKKDFLYEHLKPVVRPLLFLFDSLDQFDGEIAALEEASLSNDANQSTAAAPNHELLTPAAVRENVQFFRDQLAEALQVCEVTLMESPSGAFNAKVHRAVEVAPVAAEADGTIVRVVRSGWYLNGQLLRPAEVVVGKFRS